MKKVFLSIIMILLVSFGFSQPITKMSNLQSTELTNTSHLSFMGIPIDGNINDFKNRLVDKGATLIKIHDKGTYKIGMKSFAGRDIEYIFLVPSAKTKTIWKVLVIFIEKDSWYSLKSEYNTLLEQLTSKYGQPEKSYSTFLSPYEEGDGYEMTGVSVDKCLYFAYWKNGVSIIISTYKQVVILYEDPINSDMAKKERNEAAVQQL